VGVAKQFPKIADLSGRNRPSVYIVGQYLESLPRGNGRFNNTALDCRNLVVSAALGFLC